MTVAMINAQGAVIQEADGAIAPVVQIFGSDGVEIMRLPEASVDGFLRSVRLCAVSARAMADVLTTGSAADKALLTAVAGGQA